MADDIIRNMNNCIFCKLIAKEIPSFLIEENEQVITFLSLENHPLVVPKKHIQDIYSLDKKTGNYLMEEITRVATATKKGMESDGIYITQANGKAAGQDVFHLHFHIYPKWENSEIDMETLTKEEIVEKIKSVL